jgi:hypothetical protein
MKNDFKISLNKPETLQIFCEKALVFNALLQG